MPIFLEPDQRFPVVLTSDKDKPEGTRPTFFARSQSMRGQQRIADALDSLHGENITTQGLFSAVCDVLHNVIVTGKALVRL